MLYTNGEEDEAWSEIKVLKNKLFELSSMLNFIFLVARDDTKRGGDIHLLVSIYELSKKI